ncbi:MAG: ABC transporter permease [Candidatus Hadarchaeota archaeon]
MSGTFQVFKAVTKNWLRSKSGVFFSIMFPLMLLLIFGSVMGGTQESNYTLYVQNRDYVGAQPTELSSAFENALDSVESLDVRRIPREENVETYGDDTSFSNYRALVIPDGFQEGIQQKSTRVGIDVTLETLSRIREYFGSSGVDNEWDQNEEGEKMLENAKSFIPEENICLRIFTSGGDESAPIVRSIVSSIVGGFNERSIGASSILEIEDFDMGREGFGAVDYYLPGLIAAFIMANGIMGVTSTISEFNRNGVTKRLAATSLDKKSWIVGNVLNQAMLAFLLALVMIGAAWAVYGVEAIPGPYSLSLVFLGSAVFSTIGITLGGIIKDVEAANAAGNAIGFPMMFLSGAFFPLEIMPDFLQTVARVLPLYYLHDGLRATMIHGQPGQAFLPFVLFLCLTLVFGAVAIKTTKWKEF